jgi:hypothetical protein
MSHPLKMISILRMKFVVSCTVQVNLAYFSHYGYSLKEN